MQGLLLALSGDFSWRSDECPGGAAALRGVSRYFAGPAADFVLTAFPGVLGSFRLFVSS